MARRRRTAGLGAFVAMAAAHGMLIAWLATQASILKFRADTIADRSAVLISLQRLPSAAVHARSELRPPPVPTPEPAPARATSGPATIDQGAGAANDANLAQPVFLDWPHPLPSGVNWGRGPAAQTRLSLAEGWAECGKTHNKDEDAWVRPGKVRPPCLDR